MIYEPESGAFFGFVWNAVILLWPVDAQCSSVEFAEWTDFNELAVVFVESGRWDLAVGVGAKKLFNVAWSVSFQ